MKALNYTGVAMVEFKVNYKTGDWVLIEINGRFWGSLPLAVAAGANFPFYLYQMLVKGKRDFPQNYRTGLYCRNLLADLVWIKRNLSSDRSDPTLATLPLGQVAGEVINILAFRERSDTFVIDDLKPAFNEVLYYANLVTDIFIGKIRLFLLSLPPIRQFYRRKARRALSNANTVLLVCKGNICRSPFAEYYARAAFPESVQVISAGYYPEEGRVSPKEAIDAAREQRVDLTMHRSSILTEQTVRQAQIIFTFDEENHRNLIKHYPFAKVKTHRLGLLAQQGPIDIGDPYGGNLNDFQSAYRTIAQTIDAYIKSRTIEKTRHKGHL